MIGMVLLLSSFVASAQSRWYDMTDPDAATAGTFHFDPGRHGQTRFSLLFWKTAGRLTFCQRCCSLCSLGRAGRNRLLRAKYFCVEKVGGTYFLANYSNGYYDYFTTDVSGNSVTSTALISTIPLIVDFGVGIATPV